MELPELQSKDYLEKGYEFWKNYRITLTEIIKMSEKEEKLDKNPENIIMLAKKQGIKPTARYFNIEPSQVRYYLKKYDK